MVTRPGSVPGPSWMRNLSELATTDPRRFATAIRRFWLFFVIVMVGSTVISDVLLVRAGRDSGAYASQGRIGDLPLISVGRTAHGVLAIGGVATGGIAIGGVAAGVLAVGGAAVGVVAFGGLSAGLLAIAGVALGWRAIGAVALGHAALGALAVGRYAYAGTGVALGHYEADGKQKESLIG
jgi:hypothetical protein